MIHLITRFLRKKALIIFLLSATMIFAGCASKKADVEKLDNNEISVAPNLITDIITAEDLESTTVTVKGNRYLTYTSIKQDIPLGILFYFHETGFGESIQSTYAPESDIITAIETSELTDQEGTTRILISLKKDIPYDVTPDDSGIKISFSKTSEISASSDLAEGSKAPELVQATKPVKVIIPAATRLKSVAASKLKESIKVNVNADGIIKDYKSFTIASPARIVFDIYNIKSPFKKQKTVPVNSKWVSRVRHYGYPDKVRVVLDTKKKYLSTFSAYPIETGLEIHVGKDTGAPVPVSSEKVFIPEKKAPVPEVKPVAAEKMKPASAYTKPAWVNRIDFLSKETGKSTVIIGTTHPIKYDLVEVADKLLRIKLFNTKLPKYRRRPLITTRFESAVDRITPFFKPAVKNTSIVAVELRENVPYTVEQKEDLLLIHFEASSIPPKPFEQANLPSWKKVFAQMDVAVTEKEYDEVDEKLSPVEQKKTVEIAPGFKPETDDEKPRLSQETRYKKVLSHKAGKVYYDDTIDGDTYDLESQTKFDPYTGKEQGIDIYLGKTAKRYTGEKIALDFYETDIKNVFRILQEVGGQNFAIDHDVTGKVTLSFDKPVPWDQVLDVVLKMNQLARIYEGAIIRIATKETLKNEEANKKDRLKDRQAAKKLEDLITIFIPVSYTSAKEIADNHLREKPCKDKSKFNPERGKVTYDERLNMIIMTDVPDSIKRAKEIIQKLDKVTAQVMIEAKVVEVNSNFTKEIGVDWSSSMGPWTSEGLSGTMSGDVAMNLPVASAGTIGFAFDKITGTPFVLNAQLTAMETCGEGKIISSPKILTVDGKTAKIKHGYQYPYFEESDGDVTVKFKDIVLELEVTPMVTPDDRVLMQIHVTKDDVGDLVSAGTGYSVPSIIKNEAETELLVNDGDTIVIGGIVKSNKTTSTTGWPGLQNIPLLGWLFKQEAKAETSEELLIFITPKIVQLEQRHVVD